jgi:hypothetical protein
MTSQKTNDVGLPVSNTPKSTSTDTNTNTSVTNTLEPPIPNLIMLGVFFVATLATIYAGYIHGNMHLLTTLKNAHS